MNRMFGNSGKGCMFAVPIDTFFDCGKKMRDRFGRMKILLTFALAKTKRGYLIWIWKVL